MATNDSASQEPPTREPSARADIPDEPVGTPVFGAKRDDADEGKPIGPTPPADFWRAIYTRRSIRKFKPDPVPRELVDQVMHAGIWAPSSCNYQMWDLVAVDDAAVNRKLAALSLQMGNAPVNIVVSYGRDFSEEGWANVQSASAAIQNMSLAAHVLGLGTFWITQMGDREKVREIVGLPDDRLVVAVLALGYPKVVPKSGPKRRPMSHVTHHNYYTGRPIPSSVNPADWASDLLAVYQRARVLNGLRHNKPRAWEERAIVEALNALVPADASSPANATAARWLDVLPCTGIVTEKLWRERPGFAFDVVERTPEVAEFVAARTRPRAGMFGWPSGAHGSASDKLAHPADALAPSANALASPANPPAPSPDTLAPPADARYDVVSCFFRFENLPAAQRSDLVNAMARWVKPGGRVIIGFVSKHSFHDLTEWLRGRRGGLRGVEYVLSPDPNIGPFEALEPGAVEALCRDAGLSIEARYGCQAVPQREEIEFRTRNFSARGKSVAQGIGWLLARIEKLPGLRARRGRFRFVCARRPA